ncbi:hypothetical protein JCGZ_03822 [Jatropha curcas]|uniref:Polyprotein n=1 Tax=Jatropha curcas TaxID=180498 RepID=A0A067JME7_JATCU|nr:hypothetical protein JCGZ_03822 [Jatropha curcas]
MKLFIVGNPGRGNELFKLFSRQLPRCLDNSGSGTTLPETHFATVTIGRRRSTVPMETVTNNPIVQTSSLQLPPTCKQYLTDKIDNLVEIYHIPESTQIQNSLVPILNPYAVFKRSPSLSRHLRQIISRPSVNIKEYVQSSSLSQCVLSSTPAEQNVTLEIPEQFISQWKKQKYTHLHFGTIRLVLSYHGRQGLPVTARLSLLDTRYLQYEHAVIGTIATTLNAGSVVLTFFPNFNMSLEDPHLSTALKVQVQITGADRVPETISATLHHQIVYRLQDHAINLQTPGISHSDALYIFADGGPTPTIVQTPRQLPREEKLIPSAWITNYEKLHQLPQPVQQQDPIFVCQLDKSVRISFLPSSSESRHSVSMIQPVKSKPLKHAPIHSFAHTSKEIYAAKNDGHFLWDADPHMYDPNCPCKYEDDGWLEDAEVTITKLESQPLLRKTQSCRPSARKRPFDDDDAPPPWVGLPSQK